MDVSVSLDKTTISPVCLSRLFSIVVGQARLARPPNLIKQSVLRAKRPRPGMYCMYVLYKNLQIACCMP